METSSLPPLHSFPTIEQPEPELFGARLTRGLQHIICYCTPDTAEGARIYGEVLGLRDRLTIVVCEDGQLPCDAVQTDHGDAVPIFIDRIDDGTRHRFFEHPSAVTFVDHNYLPPREGQTSADLQTVGTSEQGLRATESVVVDDELGDLIAERQGRLREVLGDDVPLYGELRTILQSPKVRKIVIHALGPEGTNIHQVAEEYVERHGLGDKTEIIVYPGGVEPMEYAEIARAAQEEGEVHLHIRCAVYYRERELADTRTDEVVFADHHYMPLDEMQIATVDGTLAVNGEPLQLASHPSPIGLVRPWVQSGAVEHRHASSNAVAAAQVANGEADVCVTTASARDVYGLQTYHSSGSPVMIFTLGTPHSPATLRALGDE